MKSFRRWLAERILPIWARAELLRQIESLQKTVREQEIEIKQLNAYADGLEAGMKAQRRIVIHNHSEIMRHPEAVHEEVRE